MHILRETCKLPQYTFTTRVTVPLGSQPSSALVDSLFCSTVGDVTHTHTHTHTHGVTSLSGPLYCRHPQKANPGWSQLEMEIRRTCVLRIWAIQTPPLAQSLGPAASKRLGYSCRVGHGPGVHGMLDRKNKQNPSHQWAE